ncbi:uncharacterized protein FIBRA_00702 [Fibroporia radiculosa]|uniref:Uncharacterized protein n=1 Tax=Fibroporia radiculosa TaxID=599839 RepID=J4G0K0_9APHY|nr:uncharacterized protein FIBRA_00702 [Fibroporia radiculosa]CCL98698.1 predicted protein [Fibroporia radiculosa]
MAKGDITPFPLGPLPLPPPPLPPDSLPSPTSPISIRPGSFSFSAPVQRLFDFSCPAPQDRDMLPPSRARSVSSPRASTNSSPILVLKLSGPSFLDTVIRDTVSKEPLYIIETVQDLTNIYRLDSRLCEAGKAAAVRWPPSTTTSGKGKSGKSIQLGSGSWREAEDFLKQGALGNLASRKFNVPHFPHSLKWKLIPGNSYVCTSSGVKGPIAVLDAPDLVRSQQNHAGVPFLLLDYLVATSLLLTTHTQEWFDRPAGATLPGSASRSVQKWLAIIHARPFLADEHSDTRSENEQHGQDGGSGDIESLSPPSRRTSSSLWDRHLSWSSGSASNSGTSDQAMTPVTPTTPAMTPATRPPSFSLTHQSVQLRGASPGRHDDIPPVPPLPPQSVQQQQPVHLQLANPEPSPDYFSSVAMHNPDAYSSLPTYSSRPTSSSSHAVVHDRESGPSTSSSAATTIRRPRQLPKPPVPQDSRTYPQPPMTELSRVASSPPAISSAYPSTSTSASFTASPSTGSDPNAGATQLRMISRRSLRTIPPAPPPPRHAPPLPLPPKLATEYERSDGSSTSQTASYARTQSTELSSTDLANSFSSMSISSHPHPYSQQPPSHSQLITHLPPVPHPLPLPPTTQGADASGMHVDAGRVRASYAHMSPGEAESIYEMPPPAYDAIDFSTRVRTGAPKPRGSAR